MWRPALAAAARGATGVASAYRLVGEVGIAQIHGEFRRGWSVVAVALLGYAAGVSSLPLYCGGIVAAALAGATGWTHARLALGPVVGTLGVAVTLPIVGRLIPRIGARVVAAASLSGLAASFTALGFMHPSPLAYLGLMFALGVLGCGSTPIAFTQVVSIWFIERRGLALGTMLMGSGVAGLVAPPVIGHVIAQFGWRGGYFALAGIAFAVAPLVLLFLRDPATAPDPSSVQLGGLDSASFREAMSTRRLWLMTAALALGVLSISGVMFHFVMMMTAAGVGTADAARQVSILGLSVILGRLATGLALDRIFAPYLAVAFFALSALGCALLRLSDPHLGLIAGLLIGLGMGAEVDIGAYLVSGYFGLRDYPKIYGFVYGAFLLFSGAGPMVFGLIYDRFGGYGPALALSIGLLVAASMLMMFLPKFQRARAHGPSQIRWPSPKVAGRPQTNA